MLQKVFTTPCFYPFSVCIILLTYYILSGLTTAHACDVSLLFFARMWWFCCEKYRFHF